LTYVVLQNRSLRTTPVAGFILLHPSVQFKSVKGDTLFANRNFSDVLSYFSVETVPVHAEIERSIPQPDEPRDKVDAVVA